MRHQHFKIYRAPKGKPKAWYLYSKLYSDDDAMKICWSLLNKGYTVKVVTGFDEDTGRLWD